MTADEFEAWCDVPGNPEKLAKAVRSMCNVWIMHGPDGKNMTEEQRTEYTRIIELAEERGIDYHWLTMQHPRARCGCMILLEGDEKSLTLPIVSPGKWEWDMWLQAARAEVERER